MSKVKTVLLLSQAPEIEALHRDMCGIADDANKRLDELKKMAERIKESAEQRIEAIWQQIADCAQARGVMPDGFKFDKTHGLRIEHGALSIIPLGMKHTDACNCLRCIIARIVGGKK